ncbi:RING finger protein 225 [Lepisosteus oculatus]|uniref:RING finger protein 225 n=1 Tax=Lepisosteus oculatus TaxID=7918 RepID=UPI0003EA9226|nr:PREDICTED: RING finger protein 225-like [Lepisosteus oculatus]
MEPEREPQFWGGPGEVSPDLECAICFSQFNNVFRTPKMLQCQHTFCLECLARMNVKSSQPDTIRCPLCRGLTPLPNLGLPKLDNNPAILSYLPEAMQRVYSIRFNRNKGRLLVKRPTEVHGLPPLCTVSQSLDVGLPSDHAARGQSQGNALMHMSSKPLCRAFIMVSVVLSMVLLTCTIIFIISRK